MNLVRLFMKLVYSLRNRFRIIMSEYLRNHCEPPKVLGTEETIAKLLDGEFSMSRFGDGEFALANGWSIRYQKRDKKLKKRLREILKSNDENCIICVSDVFGDMNERSEENRLYWEGFVKEMRWNVYRLLDMKKTYYNTTATRVYKPLKDKSVAGSRFEKWKSLWDGKDVVFIEGSKTRLGVGNDLFNNAKSIKRIIGPAENAFDKYDELLKAASEVDKNSLIILALGPCATVLSYDLSKLGYRALDLGHIDIEYEWFLRNDSETLINTKYVNEVSGGNNVAEIEDEEYNRSIIARV